MRARSFHEVALTALLVLIAVASAVAGDAPKAKGAKYALLVGVRRYDPNELRSLPYSEPDVVGLADVLKGHGYEPGNVILMTQTAGAEAPRLLPIAAQVRKELTLLLGDMEEDDSVIVALAGHGVQYSGDAESYFCPADARLADKATLIATGEIYKQLEACRAGLKLLLVDACRNDPQSANSRARDVVRLESVARPQVTPPPGGVIAFYSCSEGEKAFEHEELKHGIFFHYVIEALKGEAVGPADGEVLVPDLEKYVKRHVRDFVREKYGVHQRPELRGTSRDLVPLVSLSRRVRVPDVVVTRPDRPAVRPEPITTPGPDRPNGPPEPITSKLGIKLVLIPDGAFDRGSPASDPDAAYDEKPRYRARIKRSFFLGVTEVTQEQYERVMGKNPSEFSAQGLYKERVAGQGTSRHPVEHVSWADAIAFCNKLSEIEGLVPYYRVGPEGQSGADGYRLPTDTEWEYACRAGSGTRYSFGDDAAGLGENDWYDGNSGAKTHPVGEKKANAFGLYDMHGNVKEWCWHDKDNNYYRYTAAEDLLDRPKSERRMTRGGSWISSSRDCRAAARHWIELGVRDGFVGFRVARVPSVH